MGYSIPDRLGLPGTSCFPVVASRQYFGAIISKVQENMLRIETFNK